MDTIELKTYELSNDSNDLKPYRTISFISHIKNILNPFKSKSLANKSPLTFVEYYINGKTLSEVLNHLNEQPENLLNNWIGALGSFKPSQHEINHLKRLMLQPLSNAEIRSVFPSNSDYKTLENGLVRYQEELDDDDILLYVCKECGDYACNGIKVNISEENDCIIWQLKNSANGLKFKFDKIQYLTVFESYLNDLMMKTQKRKH